MSSGILYVTHRVPWPPDRGDRIRTWNILKFLSAHAPVDLACLADEPVPEETVAKLKSVTRRLAIIPHSGKQRYLRGLKSLLCGRSITEGMFESSALRNVIREWRCTGEWTSAIASSSGVASFIEPPMTSPATRRWVDFMDVDSQKWLDYAKTSGFPKSLIYAAEGRRLRATEIRLTKSCDRLLVVSEAERQVFQDFCPTDRMLAVANGVDTNWFSPGVSNVVVPSCVFVGVMDYLPNADAVQWLAEHVWPQVRSRYPNAELRIVGKSPSADVQKLTAIEGVRVIGPVPDVRPWLHDSSCAVVPLRIARGIQNKVLEAMACGRPVICSPAPLKGLNAEPGLHLLSAETPEEWVNTICRVFDDAVLRQELGLSGSAWVQTHHCWDACLEPLLELTESVRAYSGKAASVNSRHERGVKA
ncbi:MAG: TIGR03087 family PEP-CTERM/XrtA system glycosyltransferase [Planctomyces sp.]|nr:TIGR03087 family PEP-CTERM/XrtA system glycosyltransferase [Planctomyces sp.]